MTSPAKQAPAPASLCASDRHDTERDDGPEPGTLERWAYDYLRAEHLDDKRSLRPPPARFEARPTPRRDTRPTRPAPLSVTDRAEKLSTHVEALRDARKRAAILHAFAHHELQAAELFCWAILSFVDAPKPFRRGLAKIARDEARHLDLYLRRAEALGARWGDFPVRDWFWQRLVSAETPAHFVATMGLGFEGANLDHGARFAALFERAGDPESAALVRHVADEERSHVAFASRWFERFTGGHDADEWAAHLCPPLSPWLMRGPVIDREARLRAAMPSAIIDAIERYVPTPRFVPRARP
jgi:uncharacterized ferritin-like protein (DUF455 family)